VRTSKLLAVVVLAVALAAPIAGIVRDAKMINLTTSTAQELPFLHEYFGSEVADRSEIPSLEGASEWLNSSPLTASSLRGKVVLIDFWTYTCINWLRTLPYVSAWDKKYRDRGLVVIGLPRILV